MAWPSEITTPETPADEGLILDAEPVVTAGGVVVVNVWSAPSVVPTLLSATRR